MLPDTLNMHVYSRENGLLSSKDFTYSIMYFDTDSRRMKPLFIGLINVP